VNLAVQNLLGQTNGELDVVINNAGIASAGISETFTPEQLHDLFDVNVFGIQRVICATLPTNQHAGDICRWRRASRFSKAGRVRGWGRIRCDL
jgi:NADP-dependent 3-hydroxy acid dehydrogenase YdfG